MVDDIAEKIRVRIMQEAYDLADRNDSEGYNSVKVMCSEVLALLPRREWVGLKEEEIVEVANAVRWSKQYHVDFARAIESLLWARNS